MADDEDNKKDVLDKKDDIQAKNDNLSKSNDNQAQSKQDDAQVKKMISMPLEPNLQLLTILELARLLPVLRPALIIEDY